MSLFSYLNHEKPKTIDITFFVCVTYHFLHFLPYLELKLPPSFSCLFPIPIFFSDKIPTLHKPNYVFIPCLHSCSESC
jgi:hypothetical protein